MRAHWHIRRFTKEDNADARKLLSQALEFDPGNAPALADLAFANDPDADRLAVAARTRATSAAVIIPPAFPKLDRT